MATKLLSLTCIRKERFSGRYPVLWKNLNRPRGGGGGDGSPSETAVLKIDDEEAIASAVFRVIGMTCSACAGSIEKEIKRLPGIHEAVIDALNNRAQIQFYPSSVNVETIRETIEDAGFEASLIENEANERSRQVCRIRINGMTCTSCSSTIESVLQSLHGVQRAHVALAIEEAEVHYDPTLLSCDKLLEEIDNAGFEAVLISTGEDVSKIDLKIDGEFTDESMMMIEKSLEALPGVQSVEISHGSDKISVLYKPDVTGPRNFIRVIESTVFGHSGHIKATVFSEGGVGRESQKQEEIKQYYKSFLWSLVFTVPVFLTAMVFMYIPGIKHLLMFKVINMLTVGEITRWLLATPVQFIIGWRFYVGSYKALRRGSANMDVLIALGTNAAYFYSLYTVLRAATSPDFKGVDFFETSAMLISFIILGKYLEIMAKGKTSQAIAKLMNLAPDTAILLAVDEEGNVTGEEEIDGRLILGMSNGLAVHG